MGVLKKTPEERAQREEQKHLAQVEKERQAFLNSPAGRARAAFEAGDHVFQCSFDVMSQQAVIVQMMGSTTTKRTADPTEVLNSVCREGWELVNGDFVFLQRGQQSRDKFMSSGQNVAISGTVLGYYLFKRCEANRSQEATPAVQDDVGQGLGPGWYTDSTGGQRWWDGQRWTDNYEPPHSQGAAHA
jgi:hypothetical protein